MNYDFYADLWDEQEKIDFRHKDENLEKKVNGTKIEFELTPKDWYSKLKEVSLFHLVTEDTKFKEAYVEYLRNIPVHNECYAVVEKDNKNKGKYFCRLCRKGGLKAGEDVVEIGVNSHLGNDEIYSGNLFKTIKDPKYNPHLPNSVFLHILFTLKKPFISKDDEEFYIIDNPICKDKVFKVPYVRPSSWKGALRYAAIREIFKDFDNLSDEDKINRRWSLFRLFGDEKDNVKEYLDELFGKDLKVKFEEELRKYYRKRKDQEINVRGRLIFYPTFFNQIGLDVIAPHDRKTKTVTQRGPIPFETVPENRSGVFSLLYFPFDLLGKDKDLEKEVKQDLRILAKAIPDMLTKYGFGAKTTSGYGVIEDEVKFQILPEMESEETDKHFSDKEKSKFVQKLTTLGDVNK